MDETHIHSSHTQQKRWNDNSSSRSMKRTGKAFYPIIVNVGVAKKDLFLMHSYNGNQIANLVTTMTT